MCLLKIIVFVGLGMMNFLSAMDCSSRSVLHSPHAPLIRKNSWVRGLSSAPSNSDVTLISAMERCFVDHADETTSKHVYHELLPMLLQIKWTNQREREWLLEYANMGSVPCLYHAINLQVLSFEEMRVTDESDIVALQSHILYFFILLEVCLELYVMHTGLDKRYIYKQIKDEFITGFKRDCKTLMSAFMRMHKSGKQAFDSAINVACEKVCSSDIFAFMDWIDAYQGIDGFRMIFKEEAMKLSIESDAILLEGLAGLSAQHLKDSYESMYRFIENKKSEFTDEGYVRRVRNLTPPPQGIKVQA